MSPRRGLIMLRWSSRTGLDFVGNPAVVVAGGNNSNGTAEAYATVNTCGTAFLSSGDEQRRARP